MAINNFEKAYLRIIDANANRLKEGLRVIEDIARFIWVHKKTTEKIKKIRHKIDFLIKKISPDYKKQLACRDSLKDIGKSNKEKSEFKRKDLNDIIVSNFKRIQESLRVLEEMGKIKDKNVAKEFKNIRFLIYEIEKKYLLKK